MKGLIIKDIMCLKKQLTIFAIVLIAVAAVSIMFAISSKCGNIAVGNAIMLEEEQFGELDIVGLSTEIMVFFMLIPPALLADLFFVFDCDKKAGFYKVSASLPISTEKRLLARFLTIYTLAAISAGTDILIAFVLSLITDVIKFKDFLGIIVSVISVISIYGALVIFFCILLGYEKDRYVQLLAIFTMLAGVVLINFNKIKTIIHGIALHDDRTRTINMWGPIDFIKEKSYILLIAALAVSVCSYFASCFIAKRKKGVI